MQATEDIAGVPISIQDQEDIQFLYKKIRSAEAKLVGPDGKSQTLPSNLYTFLCQLLGELKAGKSVTILQSNAELTTVEAAKMLSVSRQFLVQLLERDEIPYHKAGTHRRLYARDVLAYKAERDYTRRRKLEELTRNELANATYDLVPMNDSHA